ncbi:MAG: hypothetical protein H6Q90_1704 [Deltaproteobacteria bacterium]|nr:hypothetical protein [Deltaproteobacteria bacterium]
MTVKTASIITVLGFLAAAPAEAGSLSEALASHSDKDVIALRGRRDELAARCTLGAVYARRNDLSRAALYLRGCDDATLPAEISTEVARTDRDVKQRLRDSDLSVLEVVTHASTAVGEIDSLPDDPFTLPATLYLQPGQHTVRATSNGATIANSVTTYKRSRAMVILEFAATSRKPAPPTTTSVDFTQDNATEPAETAPPPPVARKNMMPVKYQRGMGLVADASNPNAIEDPLATRAERTRVARTYWLGARLGGGMFDDGASSARAGLSLAVTFRLAVSGSLFAAARLDWSRRGGGAIDALGASAGLGATLLDRSQLALAVIGQLRGDLRLADTRMTAPVPRGGLTAAAGVELALPRTPFTTGIRFEQGLTSLVPHARDRALLLELGVDLR